MEHGRDALRRNGRRRRRRRGGGAATGMRAELAGGTAGCGPEPGPAARVDRRRRRETRARRIAPERTGRGTGEPGPHRRRDGRRAARARSGERATRPAERRRLLRSPRRSSRRPAAVLSRWGHRARPRDRRPRRPTAGATPELGSGPKGLVTGRSTGHSGGRPLGVADSARDAARCGAGGVARVAGQERGGRRAHSSIPRPGSYRLRGLLTWEIPRLYCAGFTGLPVYAHAALPGSLALVFLTRRGSRGCLH